MLLGVILAYIELRASPGFLYGSLCCYYSLCTCMYSFIAHALEFSFVIWSGNFYLAIY